MQATLRPAESRASGGRVVFALPRFCRLHPRLFALLAGWMTKAAGRQSWSGSDRAALLSGLYTRSPRRTCPRARCCPRTAGLPGLWPRECVRARWRERPIETPRIEQRRPRVETFLSIFRTRSPNERKRDATAAGGPGKPECRNPSSYRNNHTQKRGFYKVRQPGLALARSARLVLGFAH